MNRRFIILYYLLVNICFIYGKTETLYNKSVELISNKIDLSGIEKHDFTYIGKIGGKYDIVMSINIIGNIIDGYYYYLKKPNQRLKLNGFKLNDTQFKINEFDFNGNNTGIFKGQFNEIENSIYGDWIKPNSAKKLSFSLKIVNYKDVSISSGLGINYDKKTYENDYSKKANSTSLSNKEYLSQFVDAAVKHQKQQNFRNSVNLSVEDLRIPYDPNEHYSEPENDYSVLIALSLIFGVFFGSIIYVIKKNNEADVNQISYVAKKNVSVVPKKVYQESNFRNKINRNDSLDQNLFKEKIKKEIGSKVLEMNNPFEGTPMEGFQVIKNLGETVEFYKEKLSKDSLALKIMGDKYEINHMIDEIHQGILDQLIINK